MNNNQLLSMYFNQLIYEDPDTNKKIKLLTSIHHIVSKNSKCASENTTSNDIILSQGVAVNTKLAGDCFTDFQRTFAFMKGTYLCVKEKIDQGIQPVNILYVGTGPYLTIILPLLFLLHPGMITITTLEINENSYSCSKQLIKKLKKENYFKSVLLTNALCFKTTDRFDLIISETMDKALTREPQVAIFAHLINLLKPQGHLIPESININLVASSINLEKNVAYNCYTDTRTKEFNDQHRQFIDNILKADKSFFQQINTASQKIWLKTVSTSQIKPGLNELLLLTEVVIFNTIRLIEDESWLTKKYTCYSFTEQSRGKPHNAFYLNTQTPRIKLIPII